MAGSSLFVLIDDIAAVLDDVAVMTKVAAKKTAGVLGDDLALNAEQVAGIRAERELPVVWAVAKGSLRNKAILVPTALLISAFAPFLIGPLLMIGGAYLCFEGVEKLVHSWWHPVKDDHLVKLEAALNNPEIDMVEFEREKIKGAVRTDFVLSAEIIVITLGTIALSPISQQITVVCLIALLMTVGVYGFVALIVKLDDIGLHLMQKSPAATGVNYWLGTVLLTAAPKLMKFLSIAGTLAMFLVGGGILSHNLAPLHHAAQAIDTSLVALPWASLWQVVVSSVFDGVTGVVAGALTLLGVKGLTKLRRRG
ncbi:MAG: hypothetical protein RL497_2403 [Pseudomonadota bacterium]|jgi:predicted DNA repair protein MutK